MKTEVKVARVEQFKSQKGNDLLSVMVMEQGNPIPYKILVYRKDLVSKPPQIGQTIIMYTDVDNRLNGTLALSWPV